MPVERSVHTLATRVRCRWPTFATLSFGSFPFLDLIGLDHVRVDISSNRSRCGICEQRAAPDLQCECDGHAPMREVYKVFNAIT